VFIPQDTHFKRYFLPLTPCLIFNQSCWKLQRKRKRQFVSRKRDTNC